MRHHRTGQAGHHQLKGETVYSPPQVRGIVFREESDSFTTPLSTARPPYPVNVALDALGEVVTDALSLAAGKPSTSCDCVRT